MMAISALATLFIACGVGYADQAAVQQSSKRGISRTFLDAHAPDQQPRFSRSEIKKMIRDAKTSGDFEQLADYFDYRAMEFEHKSQDQLKELQRLLALPYHARSYPAQVDSTRELIKRYRAQAQECSARADAYRERTPRGDDNK
jgi:hypothetical protein